MESNVPAGYEDVANGYCTQGGEFFAEEDDRTEADDTMWWTVENGNPCGQFPKCNGCGTDQNDCLEFQTWYESGNYVEEDTSGLAI